MILDDIVAKKKITLEKSDYKFEPKDFTRLWKSQLHLFMMLWLRRDFQ